MTDSMQARQNSWRAQMEFATESLLRALVVPVRQLTAAAAQEINKRSRT
jgi:hypothetical protein